MTIHRQRSCPACGRPVGRKRLHLQASLGSRWPCPGCGAELEFDGRRRAAVAGLGAVGGIAPAVLGAGMGWWWLVGLGALAYAWIWSYDSVRLRAGGSAGNPARTRV